MVENAIVYLHTGKSLPIFNELMDSVYQTFLINGVDTKVYVITNDNFIPILKEKVRHFDLRYFKIEIKGCIKNLINFIPISILENSKKLLMYREIESKSFNDTKNFRDSFWISTTLRFFYIEEFMNLFYINNIFHIENDVMLYENLLDFSKVLDKDYMYVVKDSEKRVIPSILYIKKDVLNDLNNFIISEIKKGYLNDMELLGKFNHPFLKYFNFDLTNTNKNCNYVVDGAAIGQYLGGVDPRNLQNSSDVNVNVYNNPTRGFINETCVFKIKDDIQIFRKKVYIEHLIHSVYVYYAKYKKNNDLIKIINLHIHSKQLYQFSSIYNLLYDDIISGDRICKNCDYIITTPLIYNYHKNLDKFVEKNKIIIVKDINSINIINFNKIMEESCKKVIKLFIYTHFLEDFVKYILPKISNNKKYILYIHNSDHSLNNDVFDFLKENKNIIKVYSQNINCELHKKFNLLPIGVENSMWKENGILDLYKKMSKMYNIEKNKNIYININENTFYYRKVLMNIVKNKDLEISSKKKYGEYLEELSNHYFCFCSRGNGIDTHRFWEALYLGVIPVIVVNEYTKMDNFVNYLKKLNVPFYIVNDLNKEKYNNAFFNEKLYKEINDKITYDMHMYCKMSNYFE